MADSEKKIRQEDCSEDTFGPGILTVTNKRIAFDKTRGRILDFSKKFDDREEKKKGTKLTWNRTK